MPDSNLQMRAEYVVIPPDGGWGWLVVFVAFSWNVIVDGTVYTFGLFLDEFRRDFQVSTSLLSVASSIQMSLYFLLGPLIAAMINRVGFRYVSMIGGALAFIGVLASAFIEDVYMFIFTFGLILGVAFSMTYLTSILIVGFYFSTKRALATCIAVTGTAIGVSLFPIIFSVLMADYNWRLKYQCLSGAHLLMAIMGAVYLPIEPSEVVIADKNLSTETSSIWDDYDKLIMRNTDYPTNAEVLQNQTYNIINSSTPQYLDTKSSMRSIKTGKLVSMSTIYTMQSEVPRYLTRKCCWCTCKCKYVLCPCLWHEHRPMYRDDILYHGSTHKLSQLKVDEKEYHMSVTRSSIASDTSQNADICNCCPVSVVRVLATMLDLTLLRSPAFFLLAFSGFLSYIGIYVPYVYGIQLSVDYGTERVQATYLLTAMGISNGIGRIVSGLLTMIPKLNAIIISEITLVLAGLAVIVHPFCADFALHILCGIMFGFNVASISSLRTIVVVDLLGLEKLTNAFGLIVLMEGLSSLFALPLNSFLYEATGSYVCPWVLSGFIIILSGLILIPIPRMLKEETRRKLRKKRLERERQLAASRGAQPKPGTSRFR